LRGHAGNIASSPRKFRPLISHGWSKPKTPN
jgi:hypothetical protein